MSAQPSDAYERGYRAGLRDATWIVYTYESSGMGTWSIIRVLLAYMRANRRGDFSTMASIDAADWRAAR